MRKNLSQSSLLFGPHWDGVRMACTSRLDDRTLSAYGSFNLATHVGDDPSRVAQNRARLRALLSDEPCWLEQVHGTEVYDADTASASPGVPVADAAVTTTPGRVLAVLTADCIPLIVAARGAPGLAVVHAGWRGLAQGVVEAAVGALRAKVGDQQALQAWIGPCIGPFAYEVGADVRDAFDASVRSTAFTPRTGADGKWWCNLPMLARVRLYAAGVHFVQASGLCTFTDSRFYSYRRDGATGRFATLAWLTERSSRLR